MAQVNDRRTATEHELGILRLDHFTVPVRDFEVGRKFYCDVLGGQVTKEPDWEPFQRGRTFGAHMAVQLFNADGHLVLYWQPWGQPTPDQEHPRRVLRVRSPNKLDAVTARLDAAGVPTVTSTPREAAAGAPVPATVYFRDPDGNQLAICCDTYPFHPGIRVGAFDPWVLHYPWTHSNAALDEHRSGPAAAGRGLGSTTERGYAVVTRQLDLEDVGHFTLPVRDVAKAASFYTQVVGAGVVEHEAAEGGATAQPASVVQVCPGARVSLVQQRFGWLPADVSNPHWAFEIAGDEVDDWVRHLGSWGVPAALVVRDGYVVEEGSPGRVELHFLDPDGNQIEMVAWDYSMNRRVAIGHYNAWDLAYRYDQWPPI